MRDTYIVSDVHGDYDALTRVLRSAELIVYKQGRGYVKKKDAFVLQLGDLANCVADSREGDLECLERVGDWIDLMLVGNHEMPYFDPSNRFAGFWSYEDVKKRLWELYESKLIHPSFVFSPFEDEHTLITHAGISRSQLNFGTGTTAFSVHEKLHKEWNEQNFNHYLFRDCGEARYGRAKLGGVVWCDFDKEFEPTDFPQIVGHTGGVLRTKGNAICIDTQRTIGPTVLKVG